jgi:hypothetical protein
MDQDDPERHASAVTLESLVGATLLSIGFLIYGAFGLYKSEILVPTRVGVQHLRSLDAYVFFIVVLIAVPSNIIRLWEWARDGDGSSQRYQSADLCSKAAFYGYIVYLIFGMIHGRA